MPENGQHTKLLTGLLELLSIPAFFCDRNGSLQCITPSAESLFSQLSIGEFVFEEVVRSVTVHSQTLFSPTRSRDKVTLFLIS
jgi:hypothetical protein